MRGTKMKRKFKIAGLLLGVLLIFTLSGYVYFKNEYPRVQKAPNIKIDPTPERLTRGKYLFNSLCGCMDCHSQRDFSKFGGPVIEGSEGMGGTLFDEKQGLPGKFYAKNITPAALGSWTDGEILRAVTEGVDKDGEPLFPIHPYPVFGKMDREDLYSVISYMRALKPISNEVPESEPNFPVSLIMRTMPTGAQFESRPDPLDKIASGKYLVEAADCITCHTQATSKGELINELLAAGGREFPLPGNSMVRSSNITPDLETGIGKWTREDFIKRFKHFAEPGNQDISVNPGEFNTIMPWILASSITEEDLGNMFDYLMTLKPVKNKVTIFETK
jgi:mono/diheme cytochrome c family protein